MGFHMKPLHKKLAISFIVAGILFGASCLKKSDLEAESLGDAVAPEEVALALGTGFGFIDYDDIKVGDESSLILTQTLQDGSPQMIEKQDFRVEQVVNTDASLKLSVFGTITEYNGTSSETSTPRLWEKTFTKYSGYAFSASDRAEANAADVNEPLFLFKVLQSLALGSCYDEGNYPETCHNLAVTDFDYQVSPSLAAQHNCADAYKCFITATKVEFDLVRKYEIESDGRARRIHFTFVLSKEVPFTSRVLQYCSRALYDVTGVSQKILADLCYNVNSYTFAP